MASDDTFFSVPLSAAEFVDRYLIYRLKSERAPANNVEVWLQQVRPVYDAALRERPKLAELAEKLFAIHMKLWDLESAIREQGLDEGRFASIARAIFSHNDERHRLKSAINMEFNGVNIDHRHYEDKRS